MDVSSGSVFRPFRQDVAAGGQRVSCRYLQRTNHGEGRGCKTRNEAEEETDRPQASRRW